MARLRVHFKFNPGRIGAPLRKLGDFASQTEIFLRCVAADLKLDLKEGEWIADNFENGSFDCDAEYSGAVPDLARDLGVTALDEVFGGNPLSAVGKGLISPITVAEFARIGKVLAPDEYFEAAVYRDDHAPKPPALQKITYKQTVEIRQLLEAPYVSEGAVQGIFYDWHDGAEPPFFNIRALQSGQLVHCNYPREVRDRLYAALARENAVLIVYGSAHWDRLTNSIIRIEVSNIEAAEPLPEKEFLRLFGSAPDFTGDMTTDQYIEWVRGDGD